PPQGRGEPSASSPPSTGGEGKVPGLRPLPLVQDVPPSTPGEPVTMTAAEPAPAPAAAPPLTEEQQQHLLSAVAGMLRGAVTGHPAVLPPELAELRDRPVGGAFVSVKRGKHLRSCCGVLGRPVPLLTVLQHAATRTARDDVRFPPLSPIELAH